VCDEGKVHLVVADVDVGMVAGDLGQLADAIDEGQRSAEIRELECARDLAFFELPAIEGREARDDIGLGERRRFHGASPAADAGRGRSAPPFYSFHQNGLRAGPGWTQRLEQGQQD
jgi:hypothetical protein